MKRLAIIAFVLFAVIAATAQTGEYRPISETDSQQASEAYAAYQKAKDHWEKVRGDLVKKYANSLVSEFCGYQNGCTESPYGLQDSDWEFTKDFKALVPKVKPLPPSLNWTVAPENGGVLIPIDPGIQSVPYR